MSTRLQSVLTGNWKDEIEKNPSTNQNQTHNLSIMRNDGLNRWTTPAASFKK